MESLIVDLFNKRVNIVYFFIKILLIVFCIFCNISFFHWFVFNEQLVLKLVVNLVINLLKLLKMFSIICREFYFFSNYCKIWASCHTRFILLKTYSFAHISWLTFWHITSFSGLICSALFYSMNYITFYIFTHIFMSLTNCSWGTFTRFIITWKFCNNFIRLLISISSASTFTNFNLSW